MAMADYQYITYKNVDGVAVVNFHGNGLDV